MSELKVLISDSFAFATDGIGIAIVNRHSQEERSILRFDQEGWGRWESVEPLVNTKPTIVLNNDVARALLDALMRHYQGASDMHTVRSDLLHERARVDGLIKVIGDSLHKSLDVIDSVADN